MKWDNQAVRYTNTWRPFGLVVGVLLSGLLLGIVIGLYTCTPSGTLSGPKEEAYLVLAATLYGQGESLGAMKVYLKSFAPRDPGTAMLQVADRYDKSSDRKKQQQAKDLRQLGEALKMGREPEPARTAVTTSQPAPPTTATTAPPAPTQAPPAAKPAATVQAAAPAPQPTPTPGPPPTPVSGRGVARPATGGGAIMREQPSTKAAWVGSLPNGTKVEIVRVVEGEAVDTAEPRWYLVKFENKTGYVYFKLIVPE